MVPATSLSSPYPLLGLRVPSPPNRISNIRFARCRAAVAAPPPRQKAIASASTLYDVLGLRAGATCREIKAAYRRLARECHPDVAFAAGRHSAGEFIRIHDAYATLSDPDKRARYDRDVMAVAAAAIWRWPPASRYRRRTWETDQCW